MKPTMPMSAFPGGPPGAPPPGGWPPAGGGYGGPPPGAGRPASPPKKSRRGLYIGLGCGCFVVLACLIGGLVLVASSSAIRGLFGPGEEVVSTPLTIGQPFALPYVQDGDQKYEAWLEVDVEHTGQYLLTGTILLSENGSPFGQYTLAEEGIGSPVRERDSSKRYDWMRVNLGDSGSVRGTVALFPVPARTSGAQVTLSGTIEAPPGTNGTLRLFVAERD